MLNLWIGVFKMESKDVKDVDLKKVFSKLPFFFFVSLLATTEVASYTTSGLARVTTFLLFHSALSYYLTTSTLVQIHFSFTQLMLQMSKRTHVSRRPFLSREKSIPSLTLSTSLLLIWLCSSLYLEVIQSDHPHWIFAVST